MNSQAQQKSDAPASQPRPKRDALASLRIERPDPKQARRGGKSRWPWMLLLLLVVLGGVGYGIATGKLSAPQQLSESSWMPDIMQNRIEVTLASVEVQKGRAADALVVATGYLRSHRQAGIGARTPGRINVISFEEGDKVKRGDVLAELDHKDLDASLAASKASLAKAEAGLGEQAILIDQARTDRDRAAKLRQGRSISASEYDNLRFSYASAVARMESMKADVALAKAQLRQSEQLLENMFIRAPFDGTVISKDAEEGESILPGGTGGNSGRGSVATIADLEHLEIECDVQEGYISKIAPTQEVDISVDAVPDKKYHGIVSKIIPMGDRARATIKVRVEITDADDLLFPEMSGTVYFLPEQDSSPVDEEPRMFCDEQSVTLNEEDEYVVWVVDDLKRAQAVVVEVGEAKNGRIEILGGLKGRERLVVDAEGLEAGVPVRISE